MWQSWVPHVRRWAEGEGSDERRYHTRNGMFGAVSARLLAGALGAIKPRRFIEIGSGFSSAVVLDVNDETRRDDPIRCTFIEPFPTRLDAILRGSDRENCSVLVQRVQEVPLEVFDELESGDVLFIDSSHVAKTSSDVLLELFEILPRLKSGVFIHVHDIFYPFDYPRVWFEEQNRSWNEVYFLRAFLMHNHAYAVHFWTDYFTQFGDEAIDASGTRDLIDGRPSSIWLRKS